MMAVNAVRNEGNNPPRPKHASTYVPLRRQGLVLHCTCFAPRCPSFPGYSRYSTAALP